MEDFEDQIEHEVEVVYEKTIKLIKPVKIGQVVYEELKLCEPEMHQVEKASRAATDVAVVMSLISQVAKVPLAAVGKMCQRDFKAAANFLSSIGEEDQKTGEISSQK
ncbi:phage tail assembly protein [Undibacterium sp. MH2W]|uniref:phage tail assembly protein n=1 Tax=Undibacterium sp. MH2W TaxID=3413044 RepID=UPI003BEFDF0A